MIADAPPTVETLSDVMRSALRGRLMARIAAMNDCDLAFEAFIRFRQADLSDIERDAVAALLGAH